MPRTNPSSKPTASVAPAASAPADPFRRRNPDDLAYEPDPEVHVFGDHVVCDTDVRGHATPDGRDITEIVVDASEGFIPLWAPETTLRWRFQERSLRTFVDPEATKAAIRSLLGEALVAWGDATPIRFTEKRDVWDFEVVVREADRCSPSGCILASAFFPDAGRHELVVYPRMFTQIKKEQVDTIAHEIGHVFGLRHFFANVSETAFPSQIFGEHKPFSIMNYGSQSELTEDDRSDLKRLYQLVWSGELTKINGTPIRLQTPFHATLVQPPSNTALLLRNGLAAYVAAAAPR
jgi:hypothetical protein